MHEIVERMLLDEQAREDVSVETVATSLSTAFAPWAE